jgi:hypothetical protein
MVAPQAVIWLIREPSIMSVMMAVAESSSFSAGKLNST